VNGGGFEVVQGVAKGTTVNNAGTEYVEPGGTAISTTVSSGGEEIVFSGGTAISTSVSSGGAEYAYSGGTASGTTVSSGGNEYVFAGGTISGLTVSGGGDLVVAGGTIAITNFGVANAVVSLVQALATAQGWTSPTAIYNAVASDGHGGSELSRGSSGSIDFVGIPKSNLTSSNFQIVP
jgi:autotransporter passenger strand-loop-strand repeat protein